MHPYNTYAVAGLPPGPIANPGRAALAAFSQENRYWLADHWQPGTNPPSLDKQYLRDYLETLPDWDKQPPAPHLPAGIIAGIRDRYLDLAGRFKVTV